MPVLFDRNAPIRRITVQHWRHQQWSKAADHVVVEEPLEIRVNGESLAVVMRTPGEDVELAHGFLLAEGFFAHDQSTALFAVAIEQARDELGLEIPNVIDCTMPNFAWPEFEKRRRRLPATSSCGICGRASMERVFLEAPQSHSDFKIPFTLLLQLPQRLRTAQTAFAKTGGLHAAALFSAEGELLIVREDIGRHNAVDKATGWALQRRKYPLSEYGLLVSGRLSFEMAQKALLAGIPMVAAISAASSMAVELAEESGMALIGFLREGQAVVYAGKQRLPDE